MSKAKETVPAKQETGAVADPIQYNDGLENLDDAGDFQITRLRIIQNTTSAGYELVGNVGVFADPETGESYGKEVEVIPVYIPPKTRARFEINDDGEQVLGSPPVCKSSNAKWPDTPDTPFPRTKDPDKFPCLSCPEAEFGKRDPKTRKSPPPRCRLQYNYALVIVAVEGKELDPPEGVFFSMQKGSIGAAKAFNTLLTKKKAGHAIWHKRYRLSHFVKEVSTKQGLTKFFCPQFSVAGFSSEEQVAMAEGLNAVFAANADKLADMAEGEGNDSFDTDKFEGGAL